MGGSPTPAGSAAAPAAASEYGDDDDGRGALLLTTRPEPTSRRRDYLSVRPTPGELWAFPGTMEHAVLPRRLTSEPTAAGGALRVSVAVNVYPISSPHRDAVIGHPRPLAPDDKKRGRHSCLGGGGAGAGGGEQEEEWSWESIVEMSCGLNGRGKR